MISVRHKTCVNEMKLDARQKGSQHVEGLWRRRSLPHTIPKTSSNRSALPMASLADKDVLMAHIRNCIILCLVRFPNTLSVTQFTKGIHGHFHMLYFSILQVIQQGQKVTFSLYYRYVQVSHWMKKLNYVLLFTISNLFYSCIYLPFSGKCQRPGWLQKTAQPPWIHQE